jgi:hypothetical protein
MTPIAKITNPVTPVTFECSGATIPRAVAPRASAQRPVPRSLNRNSPNHAIVVPDPLDAIAAVGKEAGLKGGSNPLWMLGALLLPAV